MSRTVRSSPLRCGSMARTVAASLSNALCTLAETSATTSSDWEDGAVCTWNPARDAVRSTTISVRNPSERRARLGGSGGGKNRQIATMMTSATTPAPRKRGRVTSKPTVEGQPLGRHDRKRRERDPGPDLEQAAVGRLDGRGPSRRQRQAVRGLELRNRIRKKIDAEPGALDFPGDALLRGVQAGKIRVRERGDRCGRQRATAAVRPDHTDGRGSRLGDDRDGLVRMEAVARNARGQHPLAQVLHEDGKRDPQRQVRFVEIEAQQYLPERLRGGQHQGGRLGASPRPGAGEEIEVLRCAPQRLL